PYKFVKFVQFVFKRKRSTIADASLVTQGAGPSKATAINFPSLVTRRPYSFSVRSLDPAAPS
ncbi:hypothetical protein ACR77V_13070, partial [Staphylococcus epidermidis]|uniref:hypothetical protein n=1 Tax=Staphylococcus epidermidis TaxID=1282 RepID=UPI003DA2304D